MKAYHHLRDGIENFGKCPLRFGNHPLQFGKCPLRFGNHPLWFGKCPLQFGKHPLQFDVNQLNLNIGSYNSFN